MARAAPPSLPRRSIAWSISPRRRALQHMFDLVHEAYLADAQVRDFVGEPQYARGISEQLEAARLQASASAPERSRSCSTCASSRGQYHDGGAYARRRPEPAGPMETGDGLLVRLVVNAPIPLHAFNDLCTAARMHGNGTMEVTARGSLRARGLTPFSAPRFAAALAALDIDINDGVPVLADPLPDDPASLIDANDLAAQLRAAIAEARLALAPKVSVVVDGGGRVDLDAIAADIRLRAVMSNGGPKFELALAGDAVTAAPIAVVEIEDVIGEVLALLKVIAARGSDARASDLVTSRAARLRAAPRQTPTRPSDRPTSSQGKCLRARARPRFRPCRFGRASSRSPCIANENGATGRGRRLTARFCSDRSAWVRPRQRGLWPSASASLRTPPIRAAASPPVRGRPSCAHGLIAARALAAEVARHVSLSGDGIAVHVSGCAKGCAHPKPALFTIVGAEQGCGIVRDARRARSRRIRRSGRSAALLDRIAIKTREAVHA